MSGWEQPLPQGVGRGVSLQFVFASYMAHVAEVEVSKDGEVRVRRVVCAVHYGSGVKPYPVRAAAHADGIFCIPSPHIQQITLEGGGAQHTNTRPLHITR